MGSIPAYRVTRSAPDGSSSMAPRSRLRRLVEPVGMGAREQFASQVMSWSAPDDRRSADDSGLTRLHTSAPSRIRTCDTGFRNAAVRIDPGHFRRQEYAEEPRYRPRSRLVDVSSCHEWCHASLLAWAARAYRSRMRCERSRSASRPVGGRLWCASRRVRWGPAEGPRRRAVEQGAARQPDPRGREGRDHDRHEQKSVTRRHIDLMIGT